MTAPGSELAPQASSRLAWWRALFSADTWRSMLYAFLALPVSIASIALAILGGSSLATVIQRGLGRRLLHIDEPQRLSSRRIIAYSVRAIPLRLVLFAVAFLTASMLFRALTYPILAWGNPSYTDTAWGGPSYLGATVLHCVLGLALGFGGLLLIRALTGQHGRFAR